MFSDLWSTHRSLPSFPAAEAVPTPSCECSEPGAAGWEALEGRSTLGLPRRCQQREERGSAHPQGTAPPLLCLPAPHWPGWKHTPGPSQRDGWCSLCSFSSYLHPGTEDGCPQGCRCLVLLGLPPLRCSRCCLQDLDEQLDLICLFCAVLERKYFDALELGLCSMSKYIIILRFANQPIFPHVGNWKSR